MDKRPGIILTSQYLNRLETLLEALPAATFPGKTELRAELDRAEVVEPQAVPPDVVTMNSKVCFALESGARPSSLLFQNRESVRQRPIAENLLENNEP